MDQHSSSAASPASQDRTRTALAGRTGGSIAVTVGGSLGLALLSTLGDWIWASYIPDGAILPGVIHGALFFLALAVILYWSSGRRAAARQLFWALPLAGLAIAAGFYPVAAMVGYLGGLLLAWIAMWTVMALLQRRARGGQENLRRTLFRAALAATGSGLAFWAISGIWTQPSPGGPDYVVHLVSWFVAFLPGLAALSIGQPVVGADRRVAESHS